MTTAVCCISHSPLMGLTDPSAEVLAEVRPAIAEARRFVTDFDPTLVVVFGVDHLNGFRYDVMPQFCIATAARSMGDYSTTAGPLRVSSDVSLACAAAVLASGVDIAVSADMVVDHGFAQPIDLLLADVGDVPLAPIFVNAAAPPRSPISRSRALGAAVGTWAASLDERVLLLGSGGLSHDPPVPSLVGAQGAVLARLVRGLTPEGQLGRENATIAVAQAFAAGNSDLRPLAPESDRAFQSILRNNELDSVDAWNDDWLTEHFGRAVHEIRTWVAAFSGLAAGGAYDVQQCYYRPIDEWIAGFGIMTATHQTHSPRTGATGDA